MHPYSSKARLTPHTRYTVTVTPLAPYPPSQAPANMGGAYFRIINNTAICNGPWLALFRDAPPPLHWYVT